MLKDLDKILTVEPTADLRAEALQKIYNSLRSGQKLMANWQGGPLAVSAVPGAGKSTGMAATAAITIARHKLHSRNHLIVVTFTRSAAANIKLKIRKYLQDLSLPQIGFFVYTLHAMALNIASRYPTLSGLDLNNSNLIDPTKNHRLIRGCVENWINTHPHHYQILLQGYQFDGEETERLRRQSVLRTEILPSLALTVIKEAKSSGFLPDDLWELNNIIKDDYEILAIAAGLYENYQNLLRSQNFIDYDDMIVAALKVLENPTVKAICQNQIFAVFEDEAQDSNPLQSKLLEILATNPNNPNQINLIRIGDPNQAINSTFTTADPIYFREFCQECEDQGLLVTMDQSGRSTQIIIDAANFVLEWVNNNEEKKAIEKYNDKNFSAVSQLSNLTLPFRSQKIYSAPSNDPQINANPDPEGRGLEIYTPRDIYHTVELIGKRAIELFAKNPEGKAAVLVRENKQGTFITEVLKNASKYNINIDLSKHNIKIYDVGKDEKQSHIPREILDILQFIDRPHSPDNLKAALKVLSNRRLIDSQDLNIIASIPEEFLYPSPLDTQRPKPAVAKARRYCCSFLDARLQLPVYQLITFLALVLQYDRNELATADKLSEKIWQKTANNHSMSAILSVLSEIVYSEKFSGVEAENNEEKYTRSQQLTIITMHKAKGLDWDYVFLPFLHEKIIPGNLYIPPQTEFLGKFNLAEIARAQIRASLHNKPIPNVSSAWEQAEVLKTAEEYRLLYVAMTRAKRLLWMSAAKQAPFNWNKPENLQNKEPCPVIPVLQQHFPAAVMTDI